MYVGRIEFDKLMAPVLRTMYGPELSCSDTECWFTETCKVVKKKYIHATISVSLGSPTDYGNQIQISIDLINFLLKGSELGQSDDRCYLPIFVADPGTNP
jgi:hypothetical protein